MEATNRKKAVAKNVIQQIAAMMAGILLFPFVFYALVRVHACIYAACHFNYKVDDLFLVAFCVASYLFSLGAWFRFPRSVRGALVIGCTASFVVLFLTALWITFFVDWYGMVPTSVHIL